MDTLKAQKLLIREAKRLKRAALHADRKGFKSQRSVESKLKRNNNYFNTLWEE